MANYQREAAASSRFHVFMYRSVVWWGDSLEINPGVSLSSVFVWDVISLIEHSSGSVHMQTEDLPLMRHLRKSPGQLRRADARTNA